MTARTGLVIENIRKGIQECRNNRDGSSSTDIIIFRLTWKESLEKPECERIYTSLVMCEEELVRLSRVYKPVLFFVGRTASSGSHIQWILCKSPESYRKELENG